jgi:hypothetical protein
VRGAELDLPIAENYRRFGREVAGKSPLYAALSESVANDPEMIAFLQRVPPPKRQPNLLLAAVRLRFGVPADYAAFKAAVLEHRQAIAEILETRRTQTNEPGRCAALLPLLAALPQPLALLEVGASAGLCLRGPPRRRRRRRLPLPPGGSRPAARPTARGRLARRHRSRAHRPGRPRRRALARGARLAGGDRPAGAPPQGDRDRAPRPGADRPRRPRRAAAAAPPQATLVVFHTAVLAYLERSQRDAVARETDALGARWIACEAPGVIPALGGAERGFLIGLDGRRVATCDSHGRWLRWGS